MFKLKRLLSLLTIILSLTLISCGGGGSESGGDSGSGGDTLYTVTFYDGDLRLTDLTLTEPYGTVIDLPTLTKDGYSFEGWKKNNIDGWVKNLDSPMTGRYTVTGNVNFHARWTEGTNTPKYTVTFYDNGELLQDLKVESGREITFPTPTKANHTFKGWLLNGEGEPLTAVSYTITANTSFVAKWTANIPIIEYTVTFYDGGVLLPQFSRTVESGMEINLPPLVSACSPFEGWLVNGSVQPPIPDYAVNANLRFDAKFTDVEYISSPEELNSIRDNSLSLSGKYRLTNDIALEDYLNGNSWNPIGDTANPFRGCLDGNGFKITDLYVDVSDSGGDVYAGLFGYIDGGEISNIGVEAAVVNANSGNDSYAGIIAGYVRNGTITDSYAMGDVKSDYVVGGLVGYMNDSSITNSYATGDVSATATSLSTYSLVGGLVGLMSNGSSIKNSYATGDVTATSYAGGLVGVMNGGSSITDSYATGDVTAGSSAGGLVGYMDSSSITDSYATGDVTATTSYSYAGGLVGRIDYSSITDSYATGNVTSSGVAGGLVGGMNGYSITNSYAKGDVTSSDIAGGLVGIMYSGDTTNSYATGYVSTGSSVSYAGGLVGCMNSSGSITDSVAANLRVEITQGTGRMGRIVGYISSSGTVTITNNFALDAMQAVGGSFDTDSASHGEDKTEAQLKDKSTYETDLGWQFGNSGEAIWKMPSGGGYPILYWQ